MILSKYAGRLYGDLMAQLEENETDNLNDLKRRAQLIWICVTHLQKLKDFFIANAPATEPEEIEFFKEIKPKFKAQLLYQQFLYDIECRKPTGDQEIVTSFYRREIKSIKRYQEVNLAFYQYYRCGAEHLDAHYFLRGKEDMHLHPFAASVDFDPLFNTSHDHKVARVIANDMLTQTLMNVISRLGHQEIIANNNGASNETMSWTQTKSGLIELIYSLHETRAIDNGNITLKRLAREFEKMFNVSLGNFYDTFDTIACRQKPTSYLDELREALRLRIGKKLK
jgi:hypothetical protein